MSKVINQVLKQSNTVPQVNQLQKVEVQRESGNIYKVNLNINNNFYCNNYNINYQTCETAGKTSNENGIPDVKSVPVRSLSGVMAETLGSEISKTPSSKALGASIIRKKSSNSKVFSNELSIPCINCGNLVDIDEIESHSNVCLSVKAEVISQMKETISLQTFNNKLKKLDECIEKKKQDNNDSHYYMSLSEFIKQASSINEVSEQSLSSLKRTLLNLDIFIEAFRGSYATLLSIERARVLISEKYLFGKEERKKSIKSKKENNPEMKAAKNKPLHEMLKGKLRLIQDREKERVYQEKIAIVKAANDQLKSPRYDSDTFQYNSEQRMSIQTETSFQGDVNSVNNTNAEDAESENDQQYITNKYVKSSNVILSDINSDIDNNSKITIGLNDGTSVSASDKSGDETTLEPEARPAKAEAIEPQNLNNSLSVKHKAFVQIFLKVKFEKIHNSNSAQQVEPIEIFKEAIRRKIAQEDWRDFIIEELKHPLVYIEKSRLSKELRKKKSGPMKISANEDLEVINEGVEEY